MNNWKVFVLFSLISFAFAFGLRCIDLPKWSDPSFMVHGEYIMGTHDAYFWLAGAKGIGSAVENPMAGLIRVLGAVTGAQYGNIAFWLPAVFAGFCAMAAFAWGMLVGSSFVGLVSAVYATSIPAYYFRTRLSYYDTDVVTLFFPLLISVLMARWISLGIRKTWLPNKEEIPEFSASVWDYLLLVIAGAITCYGKFWHADVLTFGLMASFFSFALIFLCGSSQSRPELLKGMLVYALAAFMGWIGLAASLLLVGAFLYAPLKENKLCKNIYVLAAAFIAVFALSGMGQNLLWELSIKFTAYLKPVADEATTSSGPLYPGIAQSIIEAQNLSFDVLFTNLTGSEVLCWLGFASFAFALFLVPTLSYLAPFAAITFAAVSMGGRFSMFGGIVLGIGLSFTAHWLIMRFCQIEKWRPILGAAQATVIVLLLFSNIFVGYKNAPATPIMGPAHVEALIESGKVMPKDSTVWTWWDWGYATMYYAGVNAFANGGHHGGPVLFPLGFAYATPSFLQASQLIKFSAANQNSPAAVWDKMTAKQVSNLLLALSSQKMNFPKSPKQYLVASWENIRLAYWILYYGSWNINTGKGLHPNAAPIMSAFDLNFDQGILTIKGQRPFSISSYDFLEATKITQKNFLHQLDHTLFIINLFVRALWLMILLMPACWSGFWWNHPIIRS